MANSLDTGVPWVMCQQRDAPDPMVTLNKEPSKLQLNFLTHSQSLMRGFFNYEYRSTLAMGSTVMGTNRMLKTNPQCGPRIGRDGFLRLVVLCLIDQYKILHLRLLVFTKEAEPFRTIIWLAYMYILLVFNVKCMFLN